MEWTLKVCFACSSTLSVGDIMRSIDIFSNVSLLGLQSSRVKISSSYNCGYNNMYIAYLLVYIDTPLSTSFAATTANHPQPTLLSTGVNTEGLSCLFTYSYLCTGIRIHATYQFLLPSCIMNNMKYSWTYVSTCSLYS